MLLKRLEIFRVKWSTLKLAQNLKTIQKSGLTYGTIFLNLEQIPELGQTFILSPHLQTSFLPLNCQLPQFQWGCQVAIPW